MVEWKKLGEVCNPLNKAIIKQGDLVDNGRFPVINSGVTLYGRYNQYNNDGNAFTLASRGEYAGYITFLSEKFWAGGLCYPYRSNKETYLTTKFVFLYLKKKERYIMDTLVMRGGIPALNKSDVDKILIPIPSLEEQTRIVGILDTFTSAIDNLKEQIAQRRKQYEYYRDQLLDLKGKEGVEMKTLGEVCSRLTDGSHFSPKSVEHGYYMPSVKDMTDNGFDFSSCKQISKGDYESLLNTGCKPKVNDVLIAKDGSMLKYVFPVKKEEEIVVLSSIAILTPRTDIINSAYLSYYLRGDKIKEKTIREFSSKGGVPRIILKNFKKITIIIPSLAEQQRIVSILDTFEASIQNLEAQLNQREKQYEYYRNKLLTFE